MTHSATRLCQNAWRNRYARASILAPLLGIVVSSCDATQVVAPAVPKRPTANIIQGTCVRRVPPSALGSNGGTGGYTIAVFNASCSLIAGTYYYGDLRSGVGTEITPQTYALVGAVESIQQWCFVPVNTPTSGRGTCFAGPPASPPGSSQRSPIPLYIYSSPIPPELLRTRGTNPPFQLRSRAAAMGDRG